MNDKPFLVFRYSLVEEAQSAMVSRELPEPKGKAVIDAFHGDKDFFRNGVEYAFMGFKSAIPGPNFNFPSDRFFIGKMAKHGKTHVGERVPGDVVEYIEDDWIPLVTVFDVVDQYIFVEKDWRFGTESQIAGALQAGIRAPLLSIYNHRAFVEPVTRAEQFWRVIGEHKRIYKIELELISPNILVTNRAARDALEDLKNVFNQDKVKTILENESGDLKAPKTPTSNYLEYIEEGEGSWKVVTDGGQQGGKKTHTSQDRAETVDLPVSDEETQAMDIFDGVSSNSSDKVPNDSRLAAEAFSWAARRLRKS